MRRRPFPNVPGPSLYAPCYVYLALPVCHWTTQLPKIMPVEVSDSINTDALFLNTPNGLIRVRYREICVLKWPWPFRSKISVHRNVYQHFSIYNLSKYTVQNHWKVDGLSFAHILFEDINVRNCSTARNNFYMNLLAVFFIYSYFLSAFYRSDVRGKRLCSYAVRYIYLCI